jgi:hypothetical protein
MRCTALLIAAICSLSWLSALSGRADVIVSEIMYNPDGSDLEATASREWIEIYNTGTSAVDIGGWQVGDSQDNQWASAFPANTFLQPQQALVVTGDTTTFDAQWGPGINRMLVSSFPTLANEPSPTNETAAIRKPRDGGGFDFVDQVNFDDELGWPRVTGSQAQSIFLLPQGLSTAANDLGANWMPSAYGLYGGRYTNHDGENHGSPGTVATIAQSAFAPSPDAAWSMVVLADTQNYVKATANHPVLTQMTEWIRDHRDEYKIQVVLQEGDIVNRNDDPSPSTGELPSAQQWANVQQSIFVLNGHVPYILAAGNHDYGENGSSTVRDTMVNEYFKATDNPLNDPAQGGILKGTMVPDEIQNAYYAFTAPDGRKMLIFAMEWEPRPATVAWANSVAALPEYADYTAAMVTHGYLTGNNTRYTNSRVPADHSGEELWDAFVSQHENFEMTFNGHHGGDGAGYLASEGEEENIVHQMFFNSQFETYGGDGWLRVVEFLEDGETVRVRTFSPFWDVERQHPDYSFEFQISPLPPPPPITGDYNGNGIVDAADYVVWRKTAGTSNMVADGNGDHVVNERDYAVWWNRLGETNSGGGSSPVPEPATAFTALFAALLLGGCSRRSQNHAA